MELLLSFAENSIQKSHNFISTESRINQSDYQRTALTPEKGKVNLKVPSISWCELVPALR
ncbi:MAG: hypothetical protein EDM05_59370 [Leptolyngbya sp. IPPAS B-1204]